MSGDGRGGGEWGSEGGLKWVDDKRDHGALSGLMAWGGGLTREWDNGGRKILPSWEEGLGREDGGIQDKPPGFQLCRGLALLKKVSASTRPLVA